MNPQDQRTIEQLLEQLGANEYPGEASHRYALRRSLMNSRYFEVHRARVVWERMIAIGGPAVAGGFVIVMVAFAVQIYQEPLAPGAASATPVAQMGPIRPADANEPQRSVSVEPASARTASDHSPKAVLPEVDFVEFHEDPQVTTLVDFMNQRFETAVAR